MASRSFTIQTGIGPRGPEGPAGEGSGVDTFAELTDKASADLPTINTPLATALGLLAPKASPTFTGSVTTSVLTVNGAATFNNSIDFNDGTVVGMTAAAKADWKSTLDISNVDNTSDATKNSATATLTNKTISKANNTLTGVAGSGANTDITSLGSLASMRPSSDSTTAIRVFKSDGSTLVATFDTTNSRVGFGAGATSPATAFHVKSSLPAAGMVTIGNDSASGYSSVDFRNSSNTQAAGFGYANASASNAALADRFYVYTNSKDIAFSLDNGSTVATTLKTNGDVLIGTTTSGAGKLHVAGGISTTGAILGIEQGSTPAAPAANGFVIYAEDNGSGKTRLMVRFASGASQQIAIEP